MAKRKSNCQITSWLPESEKEWLLTEQNRIDKETVIHEEKGKLALFYKHVKDFPEVEIQANRYKEFSRRFKCQS